ncbi:MAG: Crp/Fnr family transcriptional regulator [Pseudomonas sp.]|uniref:Crp/Fnr family transcriptional regulator n=1 Tax=Pseudomonas abieticivorans TaxID=2931382 RepID=UPI0020BE2AB5|nr:Crp/Fnr family transcriptional regulator [Pseudomonas sp. PIA16]MDE1168283.1 Crp/Fnr family transcriptional regulator [Pseudomonas sp.]
MNEVSAWRPRLLNGHWFSQLPLSLQDSLLQAARLQRLAAGECLFQRGEPPSGLYAVVEGAMRIGAVSEQGKEALLALVEAPHWFGEIALFDGQPRTHDAYAEVACTLVWVPQPALTALLAEHPPYWRDFALLMTQKLRLMFVVLEQQSLMAAAPRVASRLLMIAQGYGEIDGSRRVLQLGQEQLALMLSLSRQTTNQILKDLQQQGVLRLGYGEIEILDMAQLAACVAAESSAKIAPRSP